MDAKLKAIITFSVLGAVLIGVCIPLILNKIPPNCLYGFRTRKSLSTPEIWYKTNRYFGICLSVLCLAFLGCLWAISSARDSLNFTTIHYFGLAGILIATALSTIMTFLYMKKL